MYAFIVFLPHLKGLNATLQFFQVLRAKMLIGALNLLNNYSNTFSCISQYQCTFLLSPRELDHENHNYSTVVYNV